jgi:hypothetical protein
MSPSSVPVVPNDRTSCFLWLIYKYMFSSFTHHLGCSHFWATVNSAIINMGINMSLPQNDFTPFLYTYTQWWNLNHIVILFLIFWGRSILFSTMSVLIYIPIHSAHRCPFLHIISICYLLFLMVVILTGVRLSYCSFNFHLPGN